MRALPRSELALLRHLPALKHLVVSGPIRCTWPLCTPLLTTLELRDAGTFDLAHWIHMSSTVERLCVRGAILLHQVFSGFQFLRTVELFGCDWTLDFFPPPRISTIRIHDSNIKAQFWRSTADITLVRCVLMCLRPSDPFGYKLVDCQVVK